MEILIISVAAFITAILTFFSGFGLGTILTPVFMLFLPVDMAIALTGVVYFSNSLFKLFLVGRQADRQVLLRFGIPAVWGLHSWVHGSCCSRTLAGAALLFVGDYQGRQLSS